MPSSSEKLNYVERGLLRLCSGHGELPHEVLWRNLMELCELRRSRSTCSSLDFYQLQRNIETQTCPCAIPVPPWVSHSVMDSKLTNPGNLGESSSWVESQALEVRGRPIYIFSGICYTSDAWLPVICSIANTRKYTNWPASHLQGLTFSTRWRFAWISRISKFGIITLWLTGIAHAHVCVSISRNRAKQGSYRVMCAIHRAM